MIDQIVNSSKLCRCNTLTWPQNMLNYLKACFGPIMLLQHFLSCIKSRISQQIFTSNINVLLYGKLYVECERSTDWLTEGRFYQWELSSSKLTHYTRFARALRALLGQTTYGNLQAAETTVLLNLAPSIFPYPDPDDFSLCQLIIEYDHEEVQYESIRFVVWKCRPSRVRRPRRAQPGNTFRWDESDKHNQNI